MSKYCPECGAEAKDEVKVCEECGTAFETAIENPVEDKSAKKKKILIIAGVIAGVVLVVAVALVILITSILSNFGCEGTAERFVKAMANDNVDKMVSLTSDIRLDSYYYGDADDLEEDLEEEIGYLNEYFEEYVGGDFKIKYDIEDVDHYSEDVIKDTYDYIEDEYDVDTDIIKDAAVVEVEFQVSKDGEVYFFDCDLFMVKENLTWRVFSCY